MVAVLPGYTAIAPQWIHAHPKNFSTVINFLADHAVQSHYLDLQSLMSARFHITIRNSILSCTTMRSLLISAGVNLSNLAWQFSIAPQLPSNHPSQLRSSA
jgi:hypothetical protein